MTKLFWDVLSSYVAVTGFWAGVSKYGSNHSETKQVYGEWFKNTLQINIPTVIFVDADIIEVDYRFNDKIKESVAVTHIIHFERQN